LARRAHSSDACTGSRLTKKRRSSSLPPAPGIVALAKLTEPPRAGAGAGHRRRAELPQIASPKERVRRFVGENDARRLQRRDQ